MVLAAHGNDVVSVNEAIDKEHDQEKQIHKLLDEVPAANQGTIVVEVKARYGHSVGQSEENHADVELGDRGNQADSLQHKEGDDAACE